MKKLFLFLIIGLICAIKDINILAAEKSNIFRRLISWTRWQLLQETLKFNFYLDIGEQTLLTGSICYLNTEDVKLILRKGADVNQILLDNHWCETALGMLICQEAARREEAAGYKYKCDSDKYLCKNLNKIHEIAKMLFFAGATIEHGGKIKKDDWTKKYFNIDEDVSLTELINHPNCKTVFEAYIEFKNSIYQKMMEVREIAMLPPGLLPLFVSYL